jgi:hypothetical protein
VQTGFLNVIGGRIRGKQARGGGCTSTQVGELFGCCLGLDPGGGEYNAFDQALVGFARTPIPGGRQGGEGKNIAGLDPVLATEQVRQHPDQIFPNVQVNEIDTQSSSITQGQGGSGAEQKARQTFLVMPRRRLLAEHLSPGLQGSFLKNQRSYAPTRRRLHSASKLTTDLMALASG